MQQTVSVVIPVKNRADLLPITLENILAQTLRPLEIIVVDDGSTDNLLQVIKNYRDRVIFMKNEGRGPGAARNTGLKNASGNLIQFFDSDDLMTLNKLEVQEQLISKTNVGMVYSPHVKAYEVRGKWVQTDAILYYRPLPKSLRYDQWVVRGACMITQACLFDKSIFQETGLWREDLMTHEDLELLFRIGKVVPYPKHTNEAAVIYRQHGQQITDLQVNSFNRTLDGYTAMKLIRENMKGEYSLLDKITIEGNIYNSLNTISSYRKTLEKKNKGGKLAAFYNKINGKLNRLLTRSDWQILHGINSSEETFREYITMI
ncbi:MAG TPA: glycosyltransferase family 2 protein [Cytophagaceae bacterium]|jgi:hypothetical protein